jgi:SRSO17 transposase
MKARSRVPYAPTNALPELSEYLKPFHVQFTRPEPRQALDRYLTGLLTEHPNKNCDTLAAVVPGTSEQQLQGLLTDMAWDQDALNRQRVQKMRTLPTEGDAVLIFDDTGFAKQGQHSVGVARQYSGTLGKTGNCQVAVNCHYAERTIAWPVATRVYLPRSWTNDAARLQKARVPEDVAFQTKPQIALALLDDAKTWGLAWACVTADADYGDNPNFLAGLEDREQRYVVAVRCDFAVAPARRAAEPARRADAWLAELPRAAWRVVRWREGSTGWLSGRFASVRCWRVTSDGKRHIGWLIGEDSSDGKRRYYWSNFGPSVPLDRLVEYAHRRHWVEQFHEEAKELLGWDQYQGRLWPGFHRHAITVMLAYSFLVWHEWHQRQQHPRPGRPRRAFSPSTGPTTGVTAGHPSPSQRLVAAGSTTRGGTTG